LHGFTGQLQDGGTGLVSFGSRDYDPGTATWLAPDAWPGLIVKPQTLNRYAYVLGDPATLIDVGGFKAATPGKMASKGIAKAVKTGATTLTGTSMGALSGSGYARAGAAVKTPSGVKGLVSARHATATRPCYVGSMTQNAACLSATLAATIHSWDIPRKTTLAAIVGTVQLAQLRYKLDTAETQFGLANPELRQLINLPVSVPALALALAGGKDCQKASNGLIVCGGGESGWGAFNGGTTYGEVFITPDPVSKAFDDEDLLRHEQIHSTQWATYGPVIFAYAYIAEAGLSFLTTGDFGCGHFFENQAGLEAGRYYCS